MTIRDIAVAFGFVVDRDSERQAESSIKKVKNLAVKLLGTRSEERRGGKEC